MRDKKFFRSRTSPEENLRGGKTAHRTSTTPSQEEKTRDTVPFRGAVAKRRGEKESRFTLRGIFGDM